MAQQPLELILIRHLAESISLPMMVVDAENDLLFFNEAAGRVLGRSFDDAAALSLDQRVQVFDFRDERGQPVPIEALPLVVATREQRPAHAALRLRGFDGVTRPIEATAFPLATAGGHHVGAVVMFWETRAP